MNASFKQTVDTLPPQLNYASTTFSAHNDSAQRIKGQKKT